MIRRSLLLVTLCCAAGVTGDGPTNAVLGLRETDQYQLDMPAPSRHARQHSSQSRLAAGH